VCNGERYVAAAIQSLLDQSFTDFELIITDNASTDATQSICQEFAAHDSRIRYVRNDRNIGAAGNFNLGFKLASGRYFKWCAHDDFISSNFIREGARALEMEPRAVAAYGRLEYVDNCGTVIPRDRGTPDVSVFEKTFPDMRELSAARRYAMLIHAGGSDNVMFGLMRRSALATTSLHRKYYMSDRALLVEMVMQGIFVHVPEIILFNRDHPGRSTRLADKVTRATWTNPSVRAEYCFEHLSLLRQHFDTAWSARPVAPLHRTLASLLVWGMNPMRMAWCALEVIGVVSPRLRQNLGQLAWRTVNGLRGSGRLRPAGAAKD
jgi:glycosyltransferase involved in cell wall biosynthesis